jgi:hypothetical protein
LVIAVGKGPQLVVTGLHREREPAVRVCHGEELAVPVAQDDVNARCGVADRSRDLPGDVVGVVFAG